MSKNFIKKYQMQLFPLSESKEIYVTLDHNYFVKIFKISHKYKADNEITIHKKASELVPCPKIFDYFVEDDKVILMMELLDGHSLADQYGEDSSKIPDDIWKQIHAIIYKLYYNDIHYTDITAYNFMIKKERDVKNPKIYIIDFGDATEIKVNWFLKDFIDGHNGWNPDFA
jgi:serine/threonine protein kinase